MEGRVLDFIALGIFITVLITLLYAIVYIHDIPCEIAKKRNHPHQDAIHTAGWVSLFFDACFLKQRMTRPYSSMRLVKSPCLMCWWLKTNG